MARIVGDGSYYTIFDVVTRKEYQNQGIGTMLMNEIVLWYKSIEDDDTYLYLGASFKKEPFYEKFGFKSRPYGNIGAGMKYEG
jgi:GNAT superfamily N-acetyltransferase